MIKYRLQMGITGYTEDRDPGVVKNIRAAANKTPEEWPIIEIKMDFFITNDPQARIFEDLDPAQEACYNLQNEIFSVDATQYPTNPQPAGLND